MFHYLGVATELARSKTFILPVPYEATTTYGHNTRQGPRAILEASRHLELYDSELKTDISRTGIFTGTFLKPDTHGPEPMTGKIYRATKKIFKLKKFPLLLGGEHTVTVGAVRAAAESYPDLSVLQFDAHADLRNSYQNSRYNHACVMRRIRDSIKKTVSVGIRSFSEEEARYMKKNPAGRIFDAASKNLKIKEILSGLSRNIYLTIDLDALDPAIMPAVGTPEPGGLLWEDILKILKEVFQNKNVVAGDVVELAPIPGLIHPDFLAAKLIYKLIGYKQVKSK